MPGPTRFVALAFSILLCFTSASARADERDDLEVRERARRSFAEAKTAFEQHNFTAAATAFEEAARLVPHPSTWLNAAEARELASDFPRAAEDCDHVVLMDPTTTHAADATRRLERLLARVATLDVKGPPALLVRLDKDEPRALPLRKRLHPGRHAVVVIDAVSRRERRLDVEVTAGETRALDLRSIDESGDKAPAPTTPAGSAPPLASKVAFGAAITLGVATTVLGFMTVDAKSDYEAEPTRDSLDSFKRSRLVTNFALSATVLSAGLGIVLWVALPARSAAAGPGQSLVGGAARALLPGGASF